MADVIFKPRPKNAPKYGDIPPGTLFRFGVGMGFPGVRIRTKSGHVNPENWAQDNAPGFDQLDVEILGEVDSVTIEKT